MAVALEHVHRGTTPPPIEMREIVVDAVPFCLVVVTAMMKAVGVVFRVVVFSFIILAQTRAVSVSK